MINEKKLALVDVRVHRRKSGTVEAFFVFEDGSDHGIGLCIGNSETEARMALMDRLRDKISGRFERDVHEFGHARHLEKEIARECAALRGFFA